MAMLEDNIHNYLNNIYGKPLNVPDFIRTVFHTPDSFNTEIYASTAYRAEYKADYIATNLGDILTDNQNKIIEYYESELYDSLHKINRGNFSEWFSMLVKGIDTYYINSDNRNTLRKGKYVNKALKNDDVPALKLKEYYTVVISTGQAYYCNRQVFACSLFSLLFYMYKGYLPEFFYQKLNGLEDDKTEFVEEVLVKYGCNGNPGKSRIYKLANRKRPNSFALYELAEMEYYGKGFFDKPDLVAAYHYYQKAVKGVTYNPLAGWSLGYMIYNYRNNQTPLFNVTINELEYLDVDDRITMAVAHLKKAYSCGCPAAGNVLGNILTDPEIKDELKQELTSVYHLEDALTYYKNASDSEYSFAKNKLYKYYFSLYESSTDSSKKEEYFNVAFNYLKESADLGEPYAANKYAFYYLKNIKNDYEAALDYFYYAALQCDVFAASNILEYYYFSMPDRKELIRKLPIIEKDENKMSSFIQKLMDICKNSNNSEILKKYEDWVNIIDTKSYRQYN